MSKRVAIIGAGASGLTAIKSCLDDGLTPVCFEKSDDIGGLWNFRETVETDQACVMKTTVINTSKEMMAYSDFPIPDDYPNFCHNTKVQEYFRMYAEHFKLLPYIHFHHEIQLVKKSSDFDTSGRWSVRVKDLKSDKEAVEETFDAIMLCTGHHARKHLPHFVDQEKFKGRTLHTHDYRTHQGFEDKRVVVIGIGNSGGDIAVDLSKIAKQVYLSTRRGTWVINRIADNGIPADTLGTRRFVEATRGLLGNNVANSIAEKKVNNRFDHEAYGLQPKHRFFSQHPMVNDELPNRIACGSVKLVPNVRRFLENGVEFTDGNKVEAEIIVFATGYVFGFPYLDKEVLEVKDNVVELYKYAFIPDLHPNTLVVIGCMQPWGAIMPLSELQCRWACQVFKGAVQLPSPETMWADIRQKRCEMQERYVASQRHTIQVDWIPFMDELAEEFGAKPKLGDLFWKDPALALQCFFGPCTPYQYRLYGPGKWSGAREAIMLQWQRIYKGFRPNAEVQIPRRKFTMLYILLAILVLFIAWILMG